MSPDDPRHGSRAGMLQHQKDGETGCEPCREARRTYERKRKVRIILGEPRKVPAARTRRHIAALVNAGMQLQQIIDECHCESVDNIHRGELTIIHATTARRILAVKARPGENYWPAIGASRRVRALAAQGHQMSTIAERIGRAPQWLSDLASLSRGWRRIDPEAWLAIRDLYDELWRVPGNPHLAARARRKGWVTPLAWDDDKIDDPGATPDIGAQTLTPSQRHAENAADLLAHDPLSTLPKLAERLGLSANGLHVALVRAGADDLRERLNRNAELEGHTVRRAAS